MAELIGHLFLYGEPFKLNNLIRRNVFKLIGRFTIYHTVIGVLLQSGNEITASLTESCKQGVVHESAVKHRRISWL